MRKNNKTFDEIVEKALESAPKINGKSIEEIAEESEEFEFYTPLSNCDRSRKTVVDHIEEGREKLRRLKEEGE